MPGDVVEALSTGKEQNTEYHPSSKKFRERMKGALYPIRLEVLRLDGEEIIINNLDTVPIDPKTNGLGVAPGHDDMHAVVAEVTPDSSAAKAGIPGGATLTTVAGQSVKSWFDVRRELLARLQKHPAGSADAAPVTIAYETDTGVAKTAQLLITADEAKSLESNRYRADIAFDQSSDVRQAPNAWVAVKWGITETRDFILQFYLTLRRMVTGGVPAEQAMGPIGIFQAGKNFALRGNDWLLWFLSMISANLAVVNFLPIPIVDGGLFTFLILEKIKGKPLSPRTQTIAQYVGLALLLGVFLFVTYQDLTWFKFRGR
jgi:regulator of sigma E protease